MEDAPDDLLAALCDVDSPGEAAGQGVRIVTFEQMVKDLKRLPEASATLAHWHAHIHQQKAR